MTLERYIKKYRNILFFTYYKYIHRALSGFIIAITICIMQIPQTNSTAKD